jgi:hypothetical protein
MGAQDPAEAAPQREPGELDAAASRSGTPGTTGREDAGSNGGAPDPPAARGPPASSDDSASSASLSDNDDEDEEDDADGGSSSGPGTGTSEGESASAAASSCSGAAASRRSSGAPSSSAELAGARSLEPGPGASSGPHPGSDPGPAASPAAAAAARPRAWPPAWHAAAPAGAPGGAPAAGGPGAAAGGAAAAAAAAADAAPAALPQPRAPRGHVEYLEAQLAAANKALAAARTETVGAQVRSPVGCRRRLCDSTVMRTGVLPTPSDAPCRPRGARSAGRACHCAAEGRVGLLTLAGAQAALRERGAEVATLRGALAEQQRLHQALAAAHAALQGAHAALQAQAAAGAQPRGSTASSFRRGPPP